MTDQLQSLAAEIDALSAKLMTLKMVVERHEQVLDELLMSRRLVFHQSPEARWNNLPPISEKGGYCGGR